jgi:hypothetical protein
VPDDGLHCALPAVESQTHAPYASSTGDCRLELGTLRANKRAPESLLSAWVGAIVMSAALPQGPGAHWHLVPKLQTPLPDRFRFRFRFRFRYVLVQPFG